MSLNLSERVQNMKPSATLAMAQEARDLLASGADVISLSAGEPDFITPKAIREQAKLSLDQGNTHYSPVRGNKKLNEAMREKFVRDQGVVYEKEEVMCTVGAKSALMIAFTSIINPGDEVIVFSPYWISYIEQIRLCGGKPVIVTCQKEDNFMPTAQSLKKAITSKTKAIVLNSPNNPTGSVINKEQLIALADVLRDSNIWLLSDEIYEDLLFDNHKHYSPAQVSDDMRERTIVITGASKGYAMTGFRVGIVAGNKEIIGAMSKVQGQEVTCLPEFIQDAAAFALKKNNELKKDLEQMISSYQERRDLGLDLFKEHLPNIGIIKPQGAFYLWADFSHYIGKAINGKKISDDIDLATRMVKEIHVACAPGTPFGGANHLRLSVASTKEDIKKSIIRIKKWLA